MSSPEGSPLPGDGSTGHDAYSHIQAMAKARGMVLSSAESFVACPSAEELRKLQTASFIATIDFSAVAYGIFTRPMDKKDRVPLLNQVLIYEDQVRVEHFNRLADKIITSAANTIINVSGEELEEIDDLEIDWSPIQHTGVEIYQNSLHLDIKALTKAVDKRRGRRRRGL